eukprot:471293-Hanusia_phi.AAC.1
MMRLNRIAGIMASAATRTLAVSQLARGTEPPRLRAQKPQAGAFLLSTQGLVCLGLGRLRPSPVTVARRRSDQTRRDPLTKLAAASARVSHGAPPGPGPLSETIHVSDRTEKFRKLRSSGPGPGPARDSSRRRARRDNRRALDDSNCLRRPAPDEVC